MVKYVSEWVVGMDPLDRERIQKRIFNYSRFPGGSVLYTAASAIDLALWDIAGKVAGLPVYKLLGAVRDKVPVYCHARGKDSKETLENVMPKLEKYGYKAFKVGVRSLGYYPYGKAEKELDEIKSHGDPQLTMDNLARVIELWTKIPASKIREQEFQRLSQLEQRLKTHIIGQDEAIAAVSAAVRRNRVGISPKHKPVSFIFVGATGVGKTELVKQLANDLFNTPDSLIRLDMSEFMEKHSVSRIVGSPPGYVGYDEAGQLTEKIRRKPYAVVLFDEIEKAHPDVLNVLLQILDDGEITDAHGRKVTFENTIIVMTSNAGSATKEGTVGFGRSANEQDADRAMKALQQFLRPEFINRVDAVICFNRLSEENFKSIARIMLDELATSLKDKGIAFTYDDALVDFLTEKSYSLTYGARNLRRTIQKELEDPMATKIIDSYDAPITQVKATAENGTVKLYTL